jgi:hypothetical protein
MIPVKDVASRTIITLSAGYRLRKMWNENQKVPEKKKRNRAKKNVLKVENIIVKLADNFALMSLEQMREFD